MRFTSRKFLLVVAGVIVVVGNHLFDVQLDEAEVQNVLNLIFAFIGVEGIRDAVETYRAKK